MKARYYMGTAAIAKVSFPLFDNLEDAISAAAKTVIAEKEARYIVKIVAMIEPIPPPVKVTMVEDDDGPTPLPAPAVS